jgi:virginiamycin B lyase
MQGRKMVGCLLAVMLAGVIGVASPGGAKVAKEGHVTEFSAGISRGASPLGITAGPDGNVWFTEPERNRIGRITPKGKVTQFSAGISPPARPDGITAGPDGNLWFTEEEGQRIGRITPAGVITEFPLTPFPNPDLNLTDPAADRCCPSYITAGPDGNLWFNEGERIGRITPVGVITEFPVPGAGVEVVTAGPDGNVWFLGCGVEQSAEPACGIRQITPAGVITDFTAGLTPEAGQHWITAGSDGNLWFTEVEGAVGRIGQITPAGAITYFSAGISPGALPTVITAGPDGNLWFTEGGEGVDRVARITSSGVITEFSAGISAGAGPVGIAAGCDGNLWFTERAGDRIGRIGPGRSAKLPGRRGRALPAACRRPRP